MHGEQKTCTPPQLITQGFSGGDLKQIEHTCSAVASTDIV